MPRHLTARLAWHDSGWNGNICSRPSSNSYCIGTRSLLSDRLRRDRNAEYEDSVHDQPCEALLPNYEPPCFWGINAFGPQEHPVLHRHAFVDLRDTHVINDRILPYSVITWPFRISFNLDEETKSGYGKYHPKLEDRINQFFAAHREQQSIVFLYLNYDNPVSGDEQRYAVVGCGLLKEKGKPTRFDFTEDELHRYRSGKGMQHFPGVNWARMLTLDAETVVRLPYQAYVHHVRRNPEDEKKLEEISVLVDEQALVPSFKYVCDSMDDDQCLFLLHKLRRAVDRVEDHGIVGNFAEEARERLDRLIGHVWKERGPYPGLSSAVAYLAMLGEQTDEPKEERAEQFVQALRDSLSSSQDLLGEVEKLAKGNDPPSGSLKPFKALLRHVRRAVANDSGVLPHLMRLSLFSLSVFQMERLLSVDRPADEPTPFEHRTISTQDVIDNPYVLAESYVPSLNAPKWRWKEMERPLRRDGPIGVFHIDAGLFPDEDHIEPCDRYNLSPSGPERIRALVLQHLSEQATQHADCFSSVERTYEAIMQTPLFYRRRQTLRKDALTSARFLEHFSDRIKHIENAGRDYFYLREIKEAEELVERTVRRLMERPDHKVDHSWVDRWLDDEIEKLAKQVPDFDAIAFREERQEAMKALLRRSFVVLSGRPGSGKTYVVAELVRHLLAAKEPVTTLAPTGKAVLRLQTHAKICAETIDKFLFKGWLTDGGIVGPKQISDRNLERLGEIRNLVIDESSMLDLPKLATLFRVLDKQGLDKIKRVILVGDTNQLPPIGLGRPFEDIVSWLDEEQKRRERHHVHLETNCRQRNDMKILEAAELFVARNRYYDELLNELQRGETNSNGLRVFLWKDTDELAKLMDREIATLVEDKTNFPKVQKHEGLNVLFGLDKDGTVIKEHKDTLKIEAFQILTPYHTRYGHAARELNEIVHKRYKEKWWSVTAGFSHGEKVIRLSNKYDGRPHQLVLSNGSIGVIDACTESGKARAVFPFCEEPFRISGSEQEEYDLAYAITVHKAQGSDFDHVFVVLSLHRPLLTRELVYTALTRSTETVTLFLEASEKSPLELALRRSAVLGRNSSLFARPLDKNALLQPEPGEFVDSKVEYILYSALMRARDAGRLKFKHHEKLVLSVSGGTKLVKPDFLIETASGQWFLEHLGMLDLKRYAHRWQQKRTDYEAAGLGERLITTDDLNGVLSERLDEVIEDICAENLSVTPTSKYSRHHYRLWDTK